MVRVEAADKVTDELMEAVQRLVPQLSSRAGPPAREDVEEIVTSPATTLLVARAGADGEPERPDDPVVGMLTLVTFRIPTGVRARIEDVVVDSALRGRGIATALTRAALELATANGTHTVDLTSRPSREDANRLYQHLGFEERETVVYRYTLFN